MTKTRKKASDLYKKQNTLIHKAMAAVGMPYRENKDEWVRLMQSLIDENPPRPPFGKGGRVVNESPPGPPLTKGGRVVKGLSDLTLGERHLVIQHFRGKGIRLYAPGIPENVRDWKKGDPDVEYEFREDEDPQIRMVYALWADMGYRVKSLRGLVLKRFKKDDIRWLSPGELSQLVNLVLARARSKGVAHYYRKTTSRKMAQN